MQTQDDDGAIAVGLLQFLESHQSTFEQFHDCRVFLSAAHIEEMVARQRNGVIQVLDLGFVGAKVIAHDALE